MSRGVSLAAGVDLCFCMCVCLFLLVRMPVCVHVRGLGRLGGLARVDVFECGRQCAHACTRSRTRSGPHRSAHRCALCVKLCVHSTAALFSLLSAHAPAVQL